MVVESNKVKSNLHGSPVREKDNGKSYRSKKVDVILEMVAAYVLLPLMMLFLIARLGQMDWGETPGTLALVAGLAIALLGVAIVMMIQAWPQDQVVRLKMGCLTGTPSITDLLNIAQKFNRSKQQITPDKLRVIIVDKAQSNGAPSLRRRSQIILMFKYERGPIGQLRVHDKVSRVDIYVTKNIGRVSISTLKLLTQVDVSLVPFR